MQLQSGDMAPDFTLPAGGEPLMLSSLRGRLVVLYFYPKDDTSGCTQEAIDFQQRRAAFEAAGAIILGISPDGEKSHAKFKAKHDLSLTLVSDETKETLERYGVWVQKSMYGRSYMGVARTTMLIDREGRIARIWDKVKVPGHAEEVLQAAKSMA